MAIKALAVIKAIEPETDYTFRARMNIFSEGHSISDVLNDAYFEPTALPASVNAALQAFVRAYAESEWETEFGMLDTVKLLNPVSTL